MEAWNEELGWKTVNTYEEAKEWQEKTSDGVQTVEPRDNYLTTYTDTPYLTLSHTYEAMILYIIDKVNEEYPDYAQYVRVANIFILSLMRYYNSQGHGYTKEKPIRFGYIRTKHGATYLGTPHFQEYWQYIKDKEGIQGRWREYIDANGKKRESYLVRTDIPREELKKLVDDTKMIQIINGAVKKGQYSEVIVKEIRDTYNRMDKKWKLRKGESE